MTHLHYKTKGDAIAIVVWQILKISRNCFYMSEIALLSEVNKVCIQYM